MKTCCIIVVSIAKLIIMYVLQKYLQTVSSVLSSDDHLKPVQYRPFITNFSRKKFIRIRTNFVLKFVHEIHEKFVHEFVRMNLCTNPYA